MVGVAWVPMVGFLFIERMLNWLLESIGEGKVTSELKQASKLMHRSEFCSHALLTPIVN